MQQRADAKDDWIRQTDAKITESATECQIQAQDSTERYQSSRVVTSQSLWGGLEALGALKLLSGGSAAVGDLHMVTGRDLNLVVG